MGDIAVPPPYFGAGFSSSSYLSLMEQIENTIEVKGYAPFSQHLAFIIGRGKSMVTSLKGIDVSREANATLLRFFVRTESFEKKAVEASVQRKAQKILSQLERNLGVAIGETVLIASLETRISPMGELPQVRRSRVVGFYETGLSVWDEVFSIIDI